MFGHARDETIAHSLTTSIGKDLTDGHKNSDATRRQDSINDHVKLEEIYVPELLQELVGPECTSGNHLREGTDRFEKYEQHAGRERVVRLIEDILADPSVTTADGTAQMIQNTTTDFNKFVCNSNDPYRAKRVR